MSMMRIRPVLGPVLAAIAAAAFVMGGTFVLAERHYLDALGAEARGSIALQRENLAAWLGRFRSLPSVYARHPDLRAVLADPADAELRARVNTLLEGWTDATGAEESYLLGPDGRVLASSDWLDPAPRLGRDMGRAPHFREATEGRLGRWFAVDEETGARGYHLGFPVWEGARVAGVVVVAADIVAIEEEFRLSPDEIFVADAEGLVVLSGHPELRLTRIGAEKGARPIPVTGLHAAVPGDGYELVRGRADRSDRSEREFLHVVEPVATEGWVLHQLVPTAAAHGKAYLAVLLGGLVAVVIALSAALVAARRRMLLDRLLMREREGRLLERKVAARTADLSAANRRLAREVGERTAAEEELRRTQSDLVQAGKLAVLGQMSTALSHEFNQPLTAIRSYAENAAAFVEQGREDRARENLARIMRLTARMAQLSRRLSNFARKPAEGVQDVALSEVFDEALGLMEARLSRAGVVPRIEGPVAGTMVRAGAIRLQHVLMNLIGNALDATEDLAAPLIAIHVAEAGGAVTIAVEDNGAGVPEALRERVFDPFFTTKEVGRGVGLGLSISYNIVRDFGGRIAVDASDLGGARFTVTLAAGAHALAAE